MEYVTTSDRAIELPHHVLMQVKRPISLRDFSNLYTPHGLSVKNVRLPVGTKVRLRMRTGTSHIPVAVDAMVSTVGPEGVRLVGQDRDQLRAEVERCRRLSRIAEENTDRVPPAITQRPLV